MDNFDDDIKKACDVMRRGGVILYPTDTVWGIGCDATNSQAVKRVFEIKHRCDSKALIVLVDSIDALWRVVDSVPEVAEQLIEASDRPTTIVYDKGINLAPEVTAQDGSVAVRVTAEEFSRRLCYRFRRPLISTSANISGQPTAAFFSQISQDIIDSVDYVCTSRRDDTTAAKPSLIIKISADSTFKIIRK
jgi:L-threonylcarbamoyladenylate synthase